MKSSSSDQWVWVVVRGVEPSKITLWASSWWPSSQARVTSAKSESLSSIKFPNALLMLSWKSFHWRLVKEEQIISLFSLQGGHRGSEDYRLPVFFTILSTNYRLFNTLSTNFIDVYFQDILPWNRPGTWLSTQLDFHLNKFAHFWMWHDEEAKMGLSLYVYYKFSVLRVSSWWLCAKNLQNLQNYRLNYRLFGKLTTI